MQKASETNIVMIFGFWIYIGLENQCRLTVDSDVSNTSGVRTLSFVSLIHMSDALFAYAKQSHRSAPSFLLHKYYNPTTS